MVILKTNSMELELSKDELKVMMQSLSQFQVDGNFADTKFGRRAQRNAEFLLRALSRDQVALAREQGTSL